MLLKVFTELEIRAKVINIYMNREKNSEYTIFEMKNRLFNAKDKKRIRSCEEKGVEGDFKVSIFSASLWP